MRDGLPVNSVNQVIQSRTGFLWLATFDGLVRFDGVRFKVFDSGNTEGLPSNRILTVTEARDGTLWLLTEQRHVVSFRGGVFHNYGNEHSVPGNGVRVLHEDGAGAIWLGTDRGVQLLQDTAFVPVAADRISVRVSALFSGRDGTLWVGTDSDGLFGIRDGRVTHWGPPEGLPGVDVTVLSEDSSGRIWIGTRHGFAFLEDSTLTRSAWQGVVTAFLASADSTVWVGAETGVFVATGARSRPAGMQGTDARVGGARVNYPGTLRLDAQDHVWYALGPNLYRDEELVFQLPVPAGAEGSRIADIRSFAWDREGSLWLGTNAHGLHRLKPSTFMVLSQPEGVVYRNVYPVLEDRSGAIWLGTWGGAMSRISGDSITTLPASAGFPAFALSIQQDRSGRIWAGGVDAGVCIVEGSRCVPTGPLVHGDDVYAMHEDRAGAMWLGVSSGLRRVDPDGTWRRFAEADGLPSDHVRVFLEARDGTLWMGTNGGGIVRFRTGLFTRLSVADGLPSDLIRALHEDRDGVIWVGTEGSGLARIDPTGDIVVLRKRDGLFDEVVHRILEDDADRLWMSSNRGIFHVSRTELDAFARGEITRVHSTAYTERDGLRNREANGGMHPAGARTRDGRLWFPTQDGVVVVDPATIRRNELAPPVVIEQLSSHNRIVSVQGNVSLEATERDFEIDYTALSFLTPENVRFRYQLEGFNAEWVEAGARRTAFYTNVPPGQYTFRVSASNNDGVWNDEGAAVRISVAPHFHETRTFEALLVLAIALLGLTAYRWRLRSLRLRERELTVLVDRRTAALRRNELQLADRNAQLAELHETRSRLFANLSHEFRTPLTLIMGPLRSLLDGRHGPLLDSAREQGDLMLRNGQRLLRLINQVLDLARLQAGAVELNRRSHDLVAFARDATLAFAPLADRRGIALDFRSAPTELTLAFDGEHLEKVLLNLLSNALKFTPRGGTVEVCVRSVRTSDGLAVAEFAVRDSGVGIADEQLPDVFERFYQADASATRRYEGTGIGLALARELVELHGGEIRVASTPGAGSVFTVWLPLDGSEASGGPVSTAMPAADGGELRGHDTAGASAAPRRDALAAAASTWETGQAPLATPTGPAEDRTTVLVVDDNADVRTYVRSVLAATFRVIEAADGRAGLEAAKSELPDLIVADVMMPEMDGLALGRALKADPMTDAIPVVLLTARAAPQDQVVGLETGADAYLVKPFHPGVLEATVSGLLAQRRRLRDRFRQDEATSPARTVADVPEPATLDQRLRPIILAHLTEPDFGPDTLAATASLSYHQLYRGMRDELNVTPSRFIRGVRAEAAAELLRRGAGSITEIAYSVGFESLSYFNRAFRERFAASPTDYLAGPAAAGRR